MPTSFGARPHAQSLRSVREDFEREPGFYFGAAYVSYALTVALWVAVLVAMMAFDAWGWMDLGCSPILAPT